MRKTVEYLAAKIEQQKEVGNMVLIPHEKKEQKIEKSNVKTNLNTPSQLETLKSCNKYESTSQNKGFVCYYKNNIEKVGNNELYHAIESHSTNCIIFEESVVKYKNAKRLCAIVYKTHQKQGSYVALLVPEIENAAPETVLIKDLEPLSEIPTDTETIY